MQIYFLNSRKHYLYDCLSMKRILVLGGNSTVASECIDIWSRRGDEVFLAGRSRDALKRRVAELEEEHGRPIGWITADFNDPTNHAITLQAADTFMCGIDLVLFAYGTLMDQKARLPDLVSMRKELETNVFSVSSLLIEVGRYFEKSGHGQIAILSSVAGDRVRAENYVYGSTKAFVNAFAAGLKQQFQGSEVVVTTIKLGPIDSAMTSQFAKNFMWSSVAKISPLVIEAIDRGKGVVFIPGYWRWIILGLRMLPDFFLQRLAHRKLD